MNFKLLSLLILASSQMTFCAEADWEVLNLALDNINAANPSVLGNSILNILSGFLPANQQIPIPVTLPSVTTRPNTQPPIILNIDPKPVAVPQQPAPQQPAPLQPAPVDPASSISQLFLYYPELYKQLIQSMMPQSAPPAPAVVHPSPVPSKVPSVTHILSPPQGCNCDCKRKHNSIAEFEVNVPCPTTTEKPPKRIVVKVPCPTTTTTEKPCSCQCCSCNAAPHKPEKHHKKPKKDCDENVHSESEESREVKTVFKAYEVPRKSNSVRNYYKYAEDCSSEESH